MDLESQNQISIQEQHNIPEMASAGLDGLIFLTFHPFERLPTEIKTMIWKCVIQQPKVVEVEASLKNHVAIGELPGRTYELSFSLASDHTIDSLYVNKQAREITLKFEKSLVLENAENTFYLRNLENIRGNWARGNESLNVLAQDTFVVPQGIRHLAVDTDLLITLLRKKIYDGDKKFDQTLAFVAQFRDLQSLAMILDGTSGSYSLQKSARFIPGCDGLIFERGKSPGYCMKNLPRVTHWETYKEAGDVKLKIPGTISEFIKMNRMRGRALWCQNMQELRIRMVKWNKGEGEAIAGHRDSEHLC